MDGGKRYVQQVLKKSGAQAGDHAGSPLRYNAESGKRFKIIKSRGVYVGFDTSMRVETAQTFRKQRAE